MIHVDGDTHIDGFDCEDGTVKDLYVCWKWGAGRTIEVLWVDDEKGNAEGLTKYDNARLVAKVSWRNREAAF